MRLRILHIVPYEKYVYTEIGLWDKLDVKNRYVSIEDIDDSIIVKDIDRIEKISSIDLTHILQISDTYDVVVFSSLSAYMYPYVLRVPKEKIVIWQSVGYDIYSGYEPYVPIVSIPLYQPITAQFICPTQQGLLPVVWKALKQKIKQVVRNKKYLQQQNLNLVRKREQADAINRIDYVSTVLRPEYDLLKSNPLIRAKYFSFKYVVPPEVTNDYIVNFAEAKYIQLGNSGDETNNHLDVLNQIKQRNIISPLFVPMSYGGETNYKEYVIKQIGLQNPDSIVQAQYVERNLYIELLHRCRVGVFGHIRQQALGNISLLMKQGCKVFLYKDSVAYKYFKELGAYVYSIEDDLSQEAIDTPLDEKQIAYNRSLFENEYDNVLKAVEKDICQIKKIINTRIDNPIC